MALLDLLALAAVVVAAALAGRGWRRCLLPDLADDSTAVVSTTVLAAGTVLVVAQLAGLAGAFGAWTVAVGCAAVAAGATSLARVRPAAPVTAPVAPPPAEHAAVRLIGVGLVAATAVQWALAVVPTVRRGFADVDGLHYHLPHAVGYTRTGRLLPVQVLDVGHPSGWYPSNDEVLRALLLAADDLLVVLLNGAAAALLLLAAWHVGRRWGRPWTAVVMTTALLCSPLFGAVYGGWVHVDWTAIAFLVAAVAMLVTGSGAGATVVAGVALGLAAGTKLPVTPAVALVAVAALVATPAGRRVASAAQLVVPALAVGGWWYLRNLLVIGTPFPGLPGFGGPEPLPGFDDPAVAAYLLDWPVVRDWFLPGLQLFFGVGWPLLLGTLAVGVVVAVARAPGWPRHLGVAATLAAVAYVALPTTALGPPGQPVLFTANLRYLWPALALAALATAVATRGSWPAAAATVTAVAGLATGRAWAVEGPEARIVAAVVATVAIAVASRVRVPTPWVRVAAGVAVVVAAAALAGPLRSIHERDRYTRPVSATLASYTELFAAGQQLQPATTVAVSGYPLNHPFLGPDLTNELRVPHRVDSDGTLLPHRDCAGYRADLAAHGATAAAVLTGGPSPAPRELAWAVSDPGARVLASSSGGVLVALDRPADPHSCPDAAAALDAAATREVLRLPATQVREAVRARLATGGNP